MRTDKVLGSNPSRIIYFFSPPAFGTSWSTLYFLLCILNNKRHIARQGKHNQFCAASTSPEGSPRAARLRATRRPIPPWKRPDLRSLQPFLRYLQILGLSTFPGISPTVHHDHDTNLAGRRQSLHLLGPALPRLSTVALR